MILVFPCTYLVTDLCGCQGLLHYSGLNAFSSPLQAARGNRERMQSRAHVTSGGLPKAPPLRQQAVGLHAHQGTSLPATYTHAKATLKRSTGYQSPVSLALGLLPAYVVLGGLNDEPHAFQHVGNVVDPSLLYAQRLSRFVQV